jgi:very-short-patch-repair endonuclease
MNKAIELTSARVLLAAENPYEAMSLVAEMTGSPVERQFLGALVTCKKEWWTFSPGEGDALPHLIIHKNDHEYAIWQQVPCAGYVLDFLVMASCGDDRFVPLDVEIDGHDFHDRTKEQASHDRRRDRTLLKLGTRTIRFTGSDIFRDARACADEVYELLDTLLSDEGVAVQ